MAFDLGARLHRLRPETMMCDRECDITRIGGVMDVAAQFDVIIFNPENTLIKNESTLPTGATLVPKLRKMGKTLGLFKKNDWQKKDEFTHWVNRFGYSFTSKRILSRYDFPNLQEKFPLALRDRMLMVSADPIYDLPFAKSQQIQTMLILADDYTNSELPNCEPEFVAKSV